MKRTVGISELAVTDRRDDVLVTYSLGACVGLSLYDPTTGKGGIVHCLLPLSKSNPCRAKTHPNLFTDTGVQNLIDALVSMGCEPKNLVAKIAGGSRPLEARNTFSIGERNHTVLRKVLWKHRILVAAEDIGGTASRTMALYMADGRTTVRANGREAELQ